MKKFLIQYKAILCFLLGLLITVFVIIPYFHSGYFPSHDGEWAVVRAGEMFRELRDHQIPARYSSVLNFGYGYPLFNFAYPFPYYLATILHFLHFGFINSIKIIFAASVLVSYIGMFILSKKFWKSSVAGLVSGVLYVLLPYHLVDLYVRGSIGEAVSFALYPFLLYFCLLLLDKKKTYISVCSIALLTLVLVTTHNISAVFFGLIVLGYAISLLLLKRYRELLFLVGGFLWGGVMSSFFAAPALLEKNNIKLSKIPIADRNLYYVTLPKLLFSSWNYGTPTDSNPFTYALGIPQLIGYIVSIWVGLKLKNEEKVISLVFVTLTLVMILMMFPFSAIIWKLPLLQDINYPWILLFPIEFLMAFLAGSVMRIKYGGIIVIALIILCAVLYAPDAHPETFNSQVDIYYLTNPATTTSSNELMPLWVKKEPTKLAFSKVIANGQISNLMSSSNRISFDVNASKPQNLTINQIYYPGWHAYVDGRQVPISYKNNMGVMQIHVGDHKNSVILKFMETPIRLFFDVLSLISFLLLCGVSVIILWSEKYGKTKHKK